jgi:hypothetical protein
MLRLSAVAGTFNPWPRAPRQDPRQGDGFPLSMPVPLHGRVQPLIFCPATPQTLIFHALSLSLSLCATCPVVEASSPPTPPCPVRPDNPKAKDERGASYVKRLLRKCRGWEDDISIIREPMARRDTWHPRIANR